MLVVLLQSVCKPLLATVPNGKQYHIVSPVKNLNTKTKVSRINQATPSKLERFKVQSAENSIGTSIPSASVKRLPATPGSTCRGKLRVEGLRPPVAKQQNQAELDI